MATGRKPARYRTRLVTVLVAAIAVVLLLVVLLPGGGVAERVRGWLSPSAAEGGNAATHGREASVERVVDGDTLVVRLDGDRVRVRLLNIDTPETHHPDRPVECLGPEAAAYLTELLPEGTPVRLSFDREREDRYGRLLAGVFTEDGTLVNAEIVAAGLARPIVVGDNDLFLPAVLKAQADAEQARVGAFAPELGCELAADFGRIPHR